MICFPLRLPQLLLKRAYKPYSTINCPGDKALIKDTAQLLCKDAHNILVMTGAGVSTPSGIPDFRSPGTGIYDNLKRFNLPYPEAIFEIGYFRYNPAPFHTWAKEFFPGVNYRPNILHFFLVLLYTKGRLTRLYTQNIDGLESLAGMPDDMSVYAHGSFTSASCIDCLSPYDLDEMKRIILQDQIPSCNACSGLVKPDIVFFGEMLPKRFQMYAEDAAFSDCLLCLGTSLEVYPFASISDAVAMDVNRILINRNRVGSFGSRETDHVLLGDLVETVTLLAEEMGWRPDLEHLCKQKDVES